MLRLAVKPKDGKDGVIMFVKSYKYDWLFRIKVILTPLIGEALDIESIGRTDSAKITIALKTKDLYPYYVGSNDVDKLFDHNLFYVIVKCTKRGLEYYSSEKEEYDKKLKRRVQVPEFTKDINNAEFSKSLDSVNATLARMRQNSNEKITSHGVFLTVENDLCKPNIIFVLKDKKSNKTHYLRKYDLEGNSYNRVQTCDYMENALSVRYDEALKIYDDLHARRKDFFVHLHVRKENENTPARSFVPKREVIYVGLKLNV